MKPKKQQYIYVARDKKIPFSEEEYVRSFYPFELGDDGIFQPKNRVAYEESDKPFYNIKLKKGEQVRIPIDIDKAEVVR